YAQAYNTHVYSGLVDLTGDGIPDYLQWGGAGNPWYVRIGTGAGFAPMIPTDLPLGSFDISTGVDSSDGLTPTTRSGLYDMNGDGRPDFVQATPDGTFDVWELSGSSTTHGALDAGKLTRIDDAYGGRTAITYGSAKQDHRSAHDVPFPEVVVTEVE